GVGEGVCHRIGKTFRKQGSAIELQEMLFHEPSHHVRRVGEVNTVPILALKAVAVEQCHKELKISFFAVVRSCRKEKKMPGQASEKLSKAVTLRVFDLVSKVCGTELVSLVADDEIPIRLFQLRLDVLVPTELIKSRNDERVLVEPIAGSSRFE